jgi:predicted  nucleic acid-binding Zn-ribbon protein
MQALPHSEFALQLQRLREADQDVPIFEEKTEELSDEEELEYRQQLRTQHQSVVAVKGGQASYNLVPVTDRVGVFINSDSDYYREIFIQGEQKKALKTKKRATEE